MTITKTNIVNQALLKIGALVVSDVDTDSTKRATTMKELYDVKLDWLLRKYHWKFATKRVQLDVVEYKLPFAYQQGSFTVGNIVYMDAGPSGPAYGTIVHVVQDGSTGWLYLKDVTGDFGSGVIIYEAEYGDELITDVNDRTFAAASNWTDEDLATYDEAGDLTVTSNAANQYCYLANEFMSILEVAKYYYFTCNASGLSGENFKLAIQTTNQEIISSFNADANGDKILLGTGFGTDKTLQVKAVGTGGITLDDFSCREITNVALTTSIQQAITPPFEFDYIFALPSDYIQLIELYPNYLEYRLESNFILSGESSTLDIKYTYKVTDPDEMDSTFIEAFATLLAREGAIPLADSLRKQKMMDDLFEDTIADARYAGSIEDDLEDISAEDWLTERL